MEKILKKLFHKYFLYGLNNYDKKKEFNSSMDDEEYKKFLTKIAKKVNKNIKEIINQIEGLLEDAMNDIEYDMNLQLKEDAWRSDYIDDTDVTDDTYVNDKSNKEIIVKCIESENCEFKDCMHIKPHLYSDSCDRPCNNDGKTDPSKIECI